VSCIFIKPCLDGEPVCPTLCAELPDKTSPYTVDMKATNYIK
jgi:hypothetical protein